MTFYHVEITPEHKVARLIYNVGTRNAITPLHEGNVILGLNETLFAILNAVNGDLPLLDDCVELLHKLIGD